MVFTKDGEKSEMMRAVRGDEGGGLAWRGIGREDEVGRDDAPAAAGVNSEVPSMPQESRRTG